MLKKINVITKTTWHCLVGLIEYIGIPLFLAWLTTFLSPFDQKGNIVWEYIQRTTFCFSIYQVIIIGIRKMVIDTRKDALLALKTAYEIGLLCCEHPNSEIQNILIKNIKKELDNEVINPLDVISSYNNLLEYIDIKRIDAIKYEIINIQHCIDTNSLLWNYTLILRLLK